MKIRALHHDELWLCSTFGDDFYKEKPVLPGVFNFDAFYKHWSKFYEMGIGIIFGLYEDDETLIGGIGGLMAEDIYTGELKMHEMFWYVDMDKRLSTGRWSLKLVRVLKEWGRSKGAVGFRMHHLLGVHENVKDVALANYYTKHLKLTAVEVCFDGPIGG